MPLRPCQCVRFAAIVSMRLCKSDRVMATVSARPCQCDRVNTTVSMRPVSAAQHVDIHQEQRAKIVVTRRSQQCAQAEDASRVRRWARRCRTSDVRCNAHAFHGPGRFLAAHDDTSRGAEWLRQCVSHGFDQCVLFWRPMSIASATSGQCTVERSRVSHVQSSSGACSRDQCVPCARPVGLVSGTSGYG